MARKQSEWNKTVARVYKEFKGTMVKGKPFSLGDAMKKASKMKKSVKKMPKGKKGTRKMRGGNEEAAEEEDSKYAPV